MQLLKRQKIGHIILKEKAHYIVKNMNKYKFKFIDILDSAKKKRYFRLMRKHFLVAFPGESSYIKIMRKILKRKLFFQNEVFRLLLVLKNDRVVGGAIYRYWFDLKVAVLEYLFVSVNNRNKGIGTNLYKKMRQDLRRMRGRGLFFSMKGTDNLEKCPVYDEKEINMRRARKRFYRRLGAIPLNFEYSTPAYWKLKIKYANPFLCYDPLQKKNRVRVSANLVKKVIKRVMRDYYEVNPTHYRVRKILSGIKTTELRWKNEK